MTYKAYYIILFCLVIVLNHSCNKEEEQGEPCQTFVQESLIFGTYYGECIGNCAFIYKLEACQLFEDDMEYFYNSELEFLDEPLTQSKYEIALDAQILFPQDLWNETDTVFGIPDAYDQGGIFIQKELNGTVKSWQLDTNEEVLPSYLKEYASLLKTIVLELED